MKLKNPFKKKKKEDNNKGTSSSLIHVVICKLLNDRTPVEVAEFDSIQDKDNNYNMRVVSIDDNFKEELERKQHYIVEQLNYKLELSELTKEQKIKKVEEKIKQTEQDLKDIKDGKLKGVKVNRLDYEINLRHYKVLRYVVENAGDGSFEIINSAGQREMRFLSHNGIFDPYFYRSNSDKGEPLTMYADISLSRKYYKEIDEKIEARFLENQNKDNFFSGLKGIIITIAILGMVLGNVVLGIRLLDAKQTQDADLVACHEQIQQCYNSCGNDYISLLKNEVIQKNITVKKSDITKKKETSGLSDISGKILGN